ncbi:tol-pal system protein YbgF [Phenylobacterium sp.]|jgi:tol-pal system protein YbgF|uniref:tol-pal system protein YbgF n=1 Tax=Phenylobacterium sp. TaxID=1871053 RepID=UPI002F41222C
MTPKRLRLFGAAAAIVLVAAPIAVAVAQTPMDDPLDARDAKRLDRMEKVVRELRDIVFKGQKTGVPVVVEPADTDSRLGDLSTRLSDLEATLKRVNGSLDSTTHDLDQARRDNAALRAQLKSLGDRLTADEQKMAEAAQAAQAAAQAASPPTPAEPPPPADPRAAAAAANADFAKARQMMLSGDYDSAEKAFSAFVTTYPDTPKTPEARYWWGKTLSVRGDYVKAAGAYIGAIRGWPQTAWAPDAVVELARSLVQLKKSPDACQALAELPRRYPKAPPAIKERAATVKLQAKCT